MSCAGVHREFNHRIKGIGQSSFTKEEAFLLSEQGNEIVNSLYLSNFSKSSERLRAPDGSASTVDVQLLRVWIRRKYIDKAWKSRYTTKNTDGTTSMGDSNKRNKNQYEGQPTRVKIPSKKNDKSADTCNRRFIRWNVGRIYPSAFNASG